jgi:hypothetical protein
MRDQNRSSHSWVEVVGWCAAAQGLAFALRRGRPFRGSAPTTFHELGSNRGYAANAAKNGTAAGGLVSVCQRTIDTPGDFTQRGGADDAPGPEPR